ncbi:odorant receptor 13a-like [Ostrinia nubilalis]|uniref:odorant receptor 13a-like n=1 Tax=Ostrinia nubilalis TaxID=29057 RepID=UPI00308228D8
MSFFKALKGFFLKDDFDFSHPDIDLHSFHPQLQMFIANLGIFFNNRNSPLRFLWPFLNLSLSIIGIAFQLIFVYHGIEVEDYSFATECFCYFVMLSVIPILYGSVLMNNRNVVLLLDKMNKDFKFICKLSFKYRDHFLKRQLLIWQLCFTWLGFLCCVAVLYVLMTLAPLTYQSLFATQDEHMIRPLVFPMWLPKDDPYRTPNYEVFLFLQMNFLLIFIQSFGVYVYIQFHVLLHNFILLELVILDFDVIFEGLDESVVELSPYDPRRASIQHVFNKRIERIVTWHDSVFKSIATLSTVQGPVIVYQVMFSSLGICLMMYQVADKLDNGTFDILFMLLTVATTLQLWIPCYLGTLLRNKAFDVGDACWNCGWHETSLGRMIRNEILIIIMRAQHPISIKFTGLPNLSLETFSSIMSSAYSYFNMLRQYNK